MKLINKIFLINFFAFYPWTLLAHSEAGAENHHMMGNIFGWGGYGFFGMWWIMIIFWLLIITGVVGLIKWIFTEKRPEDKQNPALEVLKERYAKGEIDEKEYMKKKRDLING